jgi:hypothetical protein
MWKELKGTMDISSDSPLYDSVFINGTHYFEENINLYVRRQDPHGIYGLALNNGTTASEIAKLIIDGEYNDNNRDNDYFDGENDDNVDLC